MHNSNFYFVVEHAVVSTFVDMLVDIFHATVIIVRMIISLPVLRVAKTRLKISMVEITGMDVVKVRPLIMYRHVAFGILRQVSDDLCLTPVLLL